jgi:hypothetical protein
LRGRAIAYDDRILKIPSPNLGKVGGGGTC